MADIIDGKQGASTNGFAEEAIRVALQDADNIEHFLSNRGNSLTLDECRYDRRRGNRTA